MKKLLLATAIITTTMGSFSWQPAHSLVVSDPGVYARMATELKNLQEQLKVMKETYNTAVDTYEAVTGNGGFGVGAVPEIAKIRNKLEDITKPIHNIPTIIDTDDLDLSKIEDVQKTLDAVWKTEDGLLNDAKTAKEKEKIRQRATKSVIEQSTVAMEGMKDSIQRTEQIAYELDKTESLKESQDLTNRLLIEIISILQQQLIIESSLARAEQLAAYEGADSENEEYSDTGKKRTFGSTLREQRANSQGKIERLRNHGKKNDEALKRWGM